MGRFQVSAADWVRLIHRLDRLERNSFGGHSTEALFATLRRHSERLEKVEHATESLLRRPLTTTDKVRACPHPDDRVGEGYSTTSGKFLQCSKCGARWGP